MKQLRIGWFTHRYISRIGNDNSDNEQNSVCASEVNWRGIHVATAACPAGLRTLRCTKCAFFRSGIPDESGKMRPALVGCRALLASSENPVCGLCRGLGTLCGFGANEHSCQGCSGSDQTEPFSKQPLRRQQQREQQQHFPSGPKADWFFRLNGNGAATRDVSGK